MATRLDRLRETLSGLPKPSSAAARAYREATDALCAVVNRGMADDPDIRALIGQNPLRVMFDNHRNHAHFMSTVMLDQAWEKLPETVPWVYRAYTSQGFQPAYFPTELRLWRSAITATLPAHAADLVPLYHWLEAHHEDWLVLSQQRPPSVLEGSPTWSPLRHALFDALREGDARRALELAAAHVHDAESFLDFCEEVVQPALEEIGLRWEIGELRPVHEHRATAIALRVASECQRRLPPAPPVRGRAVVGSCTHEIHELGGYLLATVLELDGWRVSFVGADVPAGDFAAFVQADASQLVAISVTMPYNIPQAAEVVGLVRASGAAPRILVGGAAFAQHADPAAAGHPDGLLNNLREARELARTWSAA